jgi:hypothetical protein
VSCNGVPGIKPSPASVPLSIVSSGIGWGVKVMLIQPHIDIAAEVVALEALAQGLMGTSDQLFQHLALGQAVVMRQSFKRKMGDEAHLDVQRHWIKQLMAARELIGTMTNEQARMPGPGGSLSFIFLTSWF